MIHCEGNRIIVQGEVTIDTVAELTRCGMAVLYHPQMQVDLNAVTEMDSTIISMLLEWLRAADRQGNTLQFANLPASLESLIQLYGVAELIPVVSGRDLQGSAD